MKKQNTVNWLVENLEVWPIQVRNAPIVNGWSWVNSGGNIKLVSGASTISKNDWLYPDKIKKPTPLEMYEYEKNRADKLQEDLDKVDELHYDECELLRVEIAELQQKLRMKEVS